MELVDGRRAFKRPILDLCDLVVAKVTAVNKTQQIITQRSFNCCSQSSSPHFHSHFLQLGKVLKNSSCLQTGDVVVIEAAEENID